MGRDIGLEVCAQGMRNYEKLLTIERNLVFLERKQTMYETSPLCSACRTKIKMLSLYVIIEILQYENDVQYYSELTKKTKYR